MSKRITALLLCVLMLIPCFAGCSAGGGKGDSGAYITMYLTDEIYDFDPINAYYNTDTRNVVSLLFDTLFKLTANGKIENSLAKKYVIKEDEANNEYTMEITLKDAYWSNGTKLTAADVVFAWKRLLKHTNSSEAAALLYDIKNARAVKECDESIDNIGIEDVSPSLLKITFEGKIDYDQFLLNLTSVVTAPLLESYVSKNQDWAKKPSDMVCSGAFKLGKTNYKTDYDNPELLIAKKFYDDYSYQYNDENGWYYTAGNYDIKHIAFFILERNLYYFRDTKRDALTSSVTPYRILVDCTMSDEELLQEYKDGHIFYIGSIPLSLRNDDFVKENVKVSDALSTMCILPNESALINGVYLFDNVAVRQALSMVIDREAIQQKVVYAEVATGLVPPKVFDEGTGSDDFREVGGVVLEQKGHTEALSDAKKLLSDAGIVADNFTFSIKVPAYDDVNVAVANEIANAWNELGFHVSVNVLETIQNNDYSTEIEDSPKDVCDDLFVESILRQNFEVVLFDSVAYSADAYSFLASYARSFSGMALDMSANSYEVVANRSGYTDTDYDVLMEAVYYIPYFSTLNDLPKDSYLRDAFTETPYLTAAANAASKATASATLSRFAAAQITDEMSALQAKFDTIDAAITAMEEATTGVGQMASTIAQDLEMLPIRIDSVYSVVADLLDNASLSLRKSGESAKISNDTQLIADTAAATATVGTTLQSMPGVADALKAKRDAFTTDMQGVSKAAVQSTSVKKKTVSSCRASLADMKNAYDALNILVSAALNDSSTASLLAGSATASATVADSRTLYEIINQIYTENGITPTDKSSKWTEQKAKLLHVAEEKLMEDLPIIPVIFNKNASITSSKLSKIDSTYYVPASFRKTKLKDYASYSYTLTTTKTITPAKGDPVTTVTVEKVSIFASFPEIPWDKVGGEETAVIEK